MKTTKTKMNNYWIFLNSGFHKTLLVIIGGCGILVLFQLFSYSTDESNENLQFQSEFLNNYGVYSLTIPASIDFCGEKAPLSDLDIKEKLDKELLSNTYFHSNTLLYFKRANRWFPIIEPILKQNNIPIDFKYLALVESNLSNVISPAGATGYWQLMKPTAISMGLIINDEVDERYHVEKSTHAACKYLSKAYNKFNNWTLSAAAYNMGINGIQKQLTKQQTNSYYDLLLNAETARYVFRILAVKEILENPKSYGFKFRQDDLYPTVSYHELKVDSSILNLVSFAKNQGISYKTLKIFNPWLRKNKLINKEGNLYHIAIPDSGYFIHTFTDSSQNADSSKIEPKFQPITQEADTVKN